MPIVLCIAAFGNDDKTTVSRASRTPQCQALAKLCGTSGADSHFSLFGLLQSKLVDANSCDARNTQAGKPAPGFVGSLVE